VRAGGRAPILEPQACSSLAWRDHQARWRVRQLVRDRAALPGLRPGSIYLGAGRGRRLRRRLGLEAADAVADVDPWPVDVDRSDWGSVAPISLHWRIVSLLFLDLPSVADLERGLADRKADVVARGWPAKRGSG
jgi:hypothetical protein